MSNWKKPKGYADGGEIKDEAQEMPGIRVGPNANISDDTRSRAMAMIERVNKGKDPGLDSAPASRGAAPKAASRASESAARASAKEESYPEPNRARAAAPAVRKAPEEPTRNQQLAESYVAKRKAGGGSGPILPPPIDTTPKNVDTVDTRRQAERRAAAGERAAAKRAEREAAYARLRDNEDQPSLDAEEESWEELSPMQRSNARGASLRRMFGFRDGGVICSHRDYGKKR